MARSARLGAFSFLSKLLGGSVLGVAALAGAAGCAPGNPGIDVIGQLAPDDECIFTAAGTEFIIQPVLDIDPLPEGGGVEFGPAYSAQFIVQNSLISRYSTQFPVMADPNDVVATAAEVELLDAAGRRVAGGFYRTRASGVVESALGDQPGRGIVRVEVIPQSVATTLEATFIDVPAGQGLVTARIVVIGMTQAGSEIRSFPYVMPISICYGCLYRDGVLEVGQVPGCTPGQDSGYILPGFARTPACFDSGECASGACVLGHCAR